jgi:hypothetical protein
MADISVSMGVTGKDVVQGAFKDVASSAEAMGSALMEHTKKLAQLALGFEGVKIACDQFKRVLDEGGKLNDLSEQTGIAVEKLVLLQRAFQNNGLEADDVGKVVNKMQKAISDAGESGSQAADKLHKLGLFAVDLKSMNPEEQLAAFAKAINKIEDPADKSAAAMDVFGKSGGKLLSLFSNMPEEIKGAAEEVGTYAKIMGDKAAEFDKIGDKLQNALGHKVVEFFAGALSNLSGGISGLLDAVSKFDAAAFGEKITHGLSEPMQALATAITTGQFMKALELSYELVKWQAMKMGNELYHAFEGAVAGVQELFTKVFDPNGYIFNYIATGFQTLGSMIKGILIEGVLGVIDGIPGFSKVTENLKYQLETAHQEIKNGQNALATGWEVAQSELGKIVKSSADVAVNVYNSSANLFDQKAQFDKISEISKDIQSAWQHSAEAVDRFVDRLNSPTPFGQWKMGSNGALEPVQQPKTPMQEYQDSWKGNGSGPIDDGKSAPPPPGGSGGKTSPAPIPIYSDAQMSGGGLFNVKNVGMDMGQDLTAAGMEIKSRLQNQYGRQLADAQKNQDFQGAAYYQRQMIDQQNAMAQQALGDAAEKETNRQYTGSDQASSADVLRQIESKYRGTMSPEDALKAARKEYNDVVNKNKGPMADQGGPGGTDKSGSQKSPQDKANDVLDKILSYLKDTVRLDQKLPLMALS